ncbi:MAG: hypothetical protein A2Y38_04600 [Spirochaetes bacterium GWB1_59_5]|nr:MAG: hypothetical protein A2Y38_04600 [Spirochaetes bacterium GWB1_59_5]
MSETRCRYCGHGKAETDARVPTFGVLCSWCSHAAHDWWFRRHIYVLAGEECDAILRVASIRDLVGRP